jgi:proliferating cell nuclear antigen PCNA
MLAVPTETSVEPIDFENDVCVLQTVQTGPIRNLVAALKEIMADLNIIINKKELRITNYDKKHTCLCDVHVTFDKHYCSKEKITISANALHFFKLVSKVTPNDVLGFHISSRDYNDGSVEALGIQFDNQKCGQITNYKMRLFNPDEEELELPENIEYDSISIMPSVEFQKIIQTFNSLTDRVRIESIGDAIYFSAIGPWADTQICRRECTGADNRATESIQFKKKPHVANVIRGEYPLKCLLNVIKLTQSSPTIELHLKNDMPFIVKYLIGSNLGSVRVCVAPVPPTNTSYLA